MSESGDVQLGLDGLPAPEPERRPGQHDLSRSKLTEDQIQAILRARAEGVSLAATARAFAVSKHTILKLEEMRAQDVAPIKKEVASEARSAARLALSRLTEEIDEVPVGQLAVTFGILVDKSQLLDGEPTSVVSHRQDASEERRSLNQLIDSLPEADVEEVRETGSDGLDAPGKRADPAPATGPEQGADEHQNGGN